MSSVLPDTTISIPHIIHPHQQITPLSQPSLTSQDLKHGIPPSSPRSQVAQTAQPQHPNSNTYYNRNYNNNSDYNNRNQRGHNFHNGPRPYPPRGIGQHTNLDHNHHRFQQPFQKQHSDWNSGSTTGSKPNPAKTPSFDAFSRQWHHLEELAVTELAKTKMTTEEHDKKLQFRRKLEDIVCQGINTHHPEFDVTIELRCYGSFAAGFAATGSDMDLSLIVGGPDADKITHKLPRLLEKILLNAGVGARLIDKTRIPILKVCESPSFELLSSLQNERERYESVPAPTSATAAPSASTTLPETESSTDSPKPEINNPTTDETTTSPLPKPGNVDCSTTQSATQAQSQAGDPPHSAPSEKWWHRERPAGPLDFPKTSAGVLCDINFTNRLALENTELLRCYSLCDPRVGQMVQFIKSWAKRRKINSSYSGTLSSYGYVLMVLHFLMNVATPPVIPNLQFPNHHSISLDREKSKLVMEGYDATFFRDEKVLCSLAESGNISANTAPLGVLLRNFFHYFAFQGHSVVGNGFNWTQELVSIRSPGGILLKKSKGWTTARTMVKNYTEVRIRYLLSVEDPFEIDHNVARTVTYPGVLAIRDEFRRVWWYLEAVGYNQPIVEALFADPVDDPAANRYQGRREDFPRAQPHQSQPYQAKGIEADSSTRFGLSESISSHKTASTIEEFSSGTPSSQKSENIGREGLANSTGFTHAGVYTINEKLEEMALQQPETGTSDTVKTPNAQPSKPPNAAGTEISKPKRKSKYARKREKAAKLLAEQAKNMLEPIQEDGPADEETKNDDDKTITNLAVLDSTKGNQNQRQNRQKKTPKRWQNQTNTVGSTELPTPSPSMKSASPPDLSDLPNAEEVAKAYADNAGIEEGDHDSDLDPPSKKFVFSRAANPARRFKPGLDYSVYTEPTHRQPCNSYPYTTPNYEFSNAHSFIRPRRNKVRFSQAKDNVSKGFSKKPTDQRAQASIDPSTEGVTTFKRQFNPTRDNWKPALDFVDGASGRFGYNKDDKSWPAIDADEPCDW